VRNPEEPPAESLLDGGEQHQHRGHRLACSSQRGRCSRAVRALVERYLAEEALMLSRTLLEDTARLMWFARDPSELESRAIRPLDRVASRLASTCSRLSGG